jgi:hypothetical protein
MAEHPHLHPSEMTPEQRREEIATLLARGFLRLRADGDVRNATDSEIRVNRDKPLEVIGGSSPYVRAV